MECIGLYYKEAREIVAQLRKETGVSRATIYRRAKILGRFPTAEELLEKKKKGQPRKYKLTTEIPGQMRLEMIDEPENKG